MPNSLRLLPEPKRAAGSAAARVSLGTLFLLTLLLAVIPEVAFAADTTPPTRPVVTDDGAYTSSITTLRATWSSSDPQSGIAAYQYQIRRDSTAGTIIVNWTSTGTVRSVTRTGLTLLHGKLYYFAVKAKNGAGLWSAVGYSNGIRVDTTPPTAPGTPTEGSTTDLDYDGDGTYFVYWTAPSELESGISAYQLQERIGTTGTWTTLSSTITTRAFLVMGRLHNTQYFYQVRARNGADLWGLWSATSDGIRIDKTAPSAVTVTDDGASTSSATQLHAKWTTSTDLESGIAQYEYIIRQDSTIGLIIVNYTSAGLATEVTRTGLSLVNGKTYYVGVRVKNNAGLYSSTSYSDGILVDKTSPSSVTVTDDGATTTSTTQLHAKWTPSSDPESGIAGYEYIIRQDFTSGAVIVNYTSAGVATEITHSGLSLTVGKLYFIGVRAKNGAGLYSAAQYSDGILVKKLSTPPIITNLNPADGSTYLEGDSVPTQATASDADGDPLEAQFLIDGVVKQPWSSLMSWTWNTAGFPRQHQLTVQVRDPSGQQAEKTQELFGYRRPIAEPTP